jgi:hypothetical protein
MAVNALKDQLIGILRSKMEPVEVDTGDRLIIFGVPLSTCFRHKETLRTIEAQRKRGTKRVRGEYPSKRGDMKRLMRERASAEFKRLRELEVKLRGEGIGWGQAYAMGMTR